MIYLSIYLSELCKYHSASMAPWSFILSMPHVVLPSQVINFAEVDVASSVGRYNVAWDPYFWGRTCAKHQCTIVFQLGLL